MDIFWAAFGGGAAAGAFVLLAVVIAEWLRWFFDRPLVKVEMNLGTVFGDATETMYVFFEATNPHSKTVVLQGMGLGYKQSKETPMSILPAQLSSPFPYQLDGGRFFAQRISVPELAEGLKQVNRVPSDLAKAWYRSRAGQFFRGRIKKEVIEELEKYY